MSTCHFLGPAGQLHTLELPFLGTRVPAGFPSPADDYLEQTLNLGELLIRHPQATFLMRVEGDSMTGAGIHDGDLLVIDRALEPVNGRIVVVVLDGEFTVKRLRVREGRCVLAAENPRYRDIEVGEWSQLEVWGVVAHVIHRVS